MGALRCNRCSSVSIHLAALGFSRRRNLISWLFALIWTEQTAPECGGIKRRKKAADLESGQGTHGSPWQRKMTRNSNNFFLHGESCLSTSVLTNTCTRKVCMCVCVRQGCKEKCLIGINSVKFCLELMLSTAISILLSCSTLFAHSVSSLFFFSPVILLALTTFAWLPVKI